MISVDVPLVVFVSGLVRSVFVESTLACQQSESIEAYCPFTRIHLYKTHISQRSRFKIKENSQPKLPASYGSPLVVSPIFPETGS